MRPVGAMARGARPARTRVDWRRRLASSITRYPAHGLASPNGLAHGLSVEQALVTAIRELVERDALAVAWLHSLPGREVAPPVNWRVRIDGIHADVHLLDLSVAYCPWPVAAVAGSIPLRGRARYSLGAACHISWAARRRRRSCAPRTNGSC
jgi:ribosomal protein S12 methylthiotransferase accessory factor YcaO